eukprot:CAMPEP_0177655228 /NCGR_PEP_ID=MMETSP0447-20121125/14833_1 /TAXON_ID=0 /ORGANISM="Stygamoeba regulata, Strain BSH-02190019" /LENGTH=438 /DNA_ID=CAMNT_0019159089 /DNA_START=33 /DNA_END=1349 /DNA_ORIENTATION=-
MSLLSAAFRLSACRAALRPAASSRLYPCASAGLRLQPGRAASVSATNDNEWIHKFAFEENFNAIDRPRPSFQVMDTSGEVLAPEYDPNDKDLSWRMYTTMLQLNALDNVMYDIQRQGKISFYMTHYGEEAALMGSASSLNSEDVVYGQYREAGVLMWRGYTTQQMIDQCFGNKDDPGRGRQMPVHYGCPELNFHTISSPLGTQIPQAVGSAYAQKLRKENACTIVYMGDGAASEGDFHAGLNFAATLRAPVIFFCRNNKYAISTSVKEQYRGDGIVSRGVGYGIDAIRVDGNDVFAVQHATREARRRAVEEQKPTLIEAMTYRVGHHSTSDDSTRYRSMEEIEAWKENNNPITRLARYLEKKGWFHSEAEDAEMRKSMRKKVVQALRLAEKKPFPAVEHLFSDVYDVLPSHLQEQKNSLDKHLARHQADYEKILSQHA